MIEGTLLLRQWKQRPARALLTLFSIVIAVAAVAAVTLATQNARDAYRQLVETTAGAGALDLAPREGMRMPAGQFDWLADTVGVAGWMPVLHRPTVLRFAGKRVRLVAVGVDQRHAPPANQFHFVSGGPFSAADDVVLEASFAASLRATVGDRVILLHRRGASGFNVCGIVDTASALTTSESGVVFLPLTTVQRLFALPGQCDVVRVFAHDRHAAARLLAALPGRLPPDVEARRRTSRAQVSEESLRATEQGLQFIVVLGLAMSAFIVLNTFLMNVTERRKQLAILRAIGATRAQVRRMLLAEAALLGLVGAVLGTAAGAWGGQAIGMAVEKVLDTELPRVAPFEPRWLALAAVCGPLVALLAAWWPVRQASGIAPQESLAIASVAEAERFPTRMLVAAAASFALAGGLMWLAVAEIVAPQISLFAGVLMLASYVMLTPLVLAPFTRLLAAWMSRCWPVEAFLARTQMLRRRWRTVLTIGVLVVAISNAIGMGGAVLDNVDNVRSWFRRATTADLFLVPLAPQTAANIEQARDQSLEALLTALPGVTGADTVRFVSGRANSMPVVLIARPFPLDEPLPLKVTAGDDSQALQQLHEGEVIVGAVLAQRLNVKLGDMLEVQCQGRTRSVRLAATVDDYSSGGLSVFVQRDQAHALWGIDGVDIMGVRVTPQQRDEVERRMRAIAESDGMIFRSQGDLIDEVETIIQGVVASFWALLVVSFCVAAFGVSNTLAMNVQEQTQELGLLRAIGMTRRQARAAILLQAAILAAIGMALGLFSGLTTAWVINICSRPILGHAVDLQWRWPLWVAVLAASAIVVFVAAAIPAARATRLNLLDAIAWE